MPNRDDFTVKTKEILARRVGYRCSNPGCRRLTAGPKEGDCGGINLGVASHIAAAAPGGPRYSSSMTSEQRSDMSNGIWLCCTCSNLIDKDEKKYTKELLNSWKKEAETHASRELTGAKEEKEVEQIDVYKLLLLFEDLETCNREQRIFIDVPNARTNPDNFPLQENWSKIIEENQNWIGVEFSFEIHQICTRICQLKKLMSKEKERVDNRYSKSSFGIIADAGTVSYCNQLHGITQYLQEHLTENAIKKMHGILKRD